ncbi:hypothetical protein P3L10_002060 [Capsicum annuum]
MAAVAAEKADAAPSPLPSFPILFLSLRKPDAAEPAGISAGRAPASPPNINYANTIASSPVEKVREINSQGS